MTHYARTLRHAPDSARRPLAAFAFFEATLRYGCRAYTVYNHMFLPSYYDDPVNEYWHLLNG